MLLFVAFLMICFRFVVRLFGLLVIAFACLSACLISCLFIVLNVRNVL